MQNVTDRHRRWVTNYIVGKVRELRYHLRAIVDASDESLRLFGQRQAVPKSNNETLIYGFSSFTNAIQTLKDSVATATGQPVPWAEIRKLRHGAFLAAARNAATHDGNPIVSAWADGRYFVPAKILRLDQSGNLIEIPAPLEDIRTLCLEFAADFCQLLSATLPKAESEGLGGGWFSVSELDEAFAESTFIPEFAKQLFAKQRAEIASQLSNITHNPVAEALGCLGDTIDYCNSMLEKPPAE